MKINSNLTHNLHQPNFGMSFKINRDASNLIARKTGNDMFEVRDIIEKENKNKNREICLHTFTNDFLDDEGFYAKISYSNTPKTIVTSQGEHFFHKITDALKDFIKIADKNTPKQ